MTSVTERLIAERLGPRDRQLIEQAAGGAVSLEEALASPELERLVFAPTAVLDPLAPVPSPFLAFAVAVHRSALELDSATSIREWVGPRQRLFVLDVQPLRDFVADPLRRHFLAELLTSYTKVSSGSVWVRTARGLRRRRFSELDPVHLATLLEQAPPEERSGIYRRLGDLSLFLTGVFPDYTAERALSLVAEERLRRVSGLGPIDVGTRSEGPFSWTTGSATGAVALFEELGARSYRRAAEETAGVLLGTMAVIEDVAERFVDARRVLNFLTERYLFASRDRWFGGGPGTP
jgi:hypothetical protein